MKKIAALVLAVILSLPATSFAEDYFENGEPSAGAIVFDVILVRPLGLATFALGTGFFVVSLPFTVLSGSVGTAAKKLIAEPLAFTFTRPVGEISE